MGDSTLIASTGKLTRQQLTAIPTPLGTATHRPVPHSEVVEALIETLSFRHIGIVNDEFAVSKDGMKLFGVLDLDTGMHGCRFSIGIRNAHDKSMRLAMTVGYRVAEQPSLPDRRLTEFKQACMEAAKCYKTPAEAQREITGMEERLLEDSRDHITITEEEPEPAKASFFDELRKGTDGHDSPPPPPAKKRKRTRKAEPL